MLRSPSLPQKVARTAERRVSVERRASKTRGGQGIVRSLGKEAAVSEEGKKNLSRLMLTITLYKQCNVSLERVFSFSNYRLLITLLDELLSSGTRTKFIFGTESLQKYSYLLVLLV